MKRRHAALALCGLAVGCGPSASPDGSTPGELPVEVLSGPTLEIGVLDGADEYIFGAIESVVPLGDGTLAVSDVGATRISIYDREGKYLRSWGSAGDGPGEFRSLSRLYPLGADSLMAAERADGGLSVFDLQGSLGRQAAASDISGDSVFGLDSWLYGRFWVNGALRSEARARVRAALDRLPSPRLSPGYRSVLAGADGGLWIREGTPSGEIVRWTHTDASGWPVAVVEVPARFRPTHVTSDEVLGVWSGESDVHFVRSYRIADTDRTATAPAWLLGAESVATREAPPNEAELMSLMVGSIKRMASAQEIHYSEHMTYTPDVSFLEAFEQPEGIVIDFVHGTPRGWGAVFTHPAIDRVCALAYGFDIPPGWTPGMVLCGPQRAAAAADGA